MMTLLRNLLTVIGVLAIIAVGLFFFRGDLYRPIFPSQPKPQPPALSGKIYATLSSSRGALIEDKGVTDPNGLPFDIAEITEGEAEGFPASTSPSLTIINTGKREIRHWKLAQNVRKISLRATQLYDVKVKERSGPPGAPYQIEIWVPREADLNLAFEIGPLVAGAGS
jgi:hypothetical protein